MAKYAVTLYDSPAALEAGIETVDNDVEISAVHLPDNIQHKYGLIQGSKLGITGDALDVNIKSGIDTLATHAKQTDGSQKTQVVDGAGDVIGSTANALDINIKSTAVQEGWEYSGSGAPTSTPAPPTGVVPRYYDYTNHTTYVWADAAWREYLGIIDGGTL
jgi:hypothetical protein